MLVLLLALEHGKFGHPAQCILTGKRGDYTSLGSLVSLGSLRVLH